MVERVMVDPSRRRIDTSNGIGLTEKWRSASRAAAEDEGEKWRERERGTSTVGRGHVARSTALAEHCINRNHSSSQPQQQHAAMRMQ